MIGWDDSIVVNASAATCYDKAVDLDNCQRWISQVQAIEKLYQGDLTVGSQCKETRKEGRRVHTMTLEVFESHAPSQGDPPYVHGAGASMSSMSSMSSMKSYYRFIFEAAGEKACKTRSPGRTKEVTTHPLPPKKA